MSNLAEHPPSVSSNCSTQTPVTAEKLTSIFSHEIQVKVCYCCSLTPVDSDAFGKILIWNMQVDAPWLRQTTVGKEAVRVGYVSIQVPAHWLCLVSPGMKLKLSNTGLVTVAALERYKRLFTQSLSVTSTVLKRTLCGSPQSFFLFGAPWQCTANLTPPW